MLLNYKLTFYVCKIFYLNHSDNSNIIKLTNQVLDTIISTIEWFFVHEGKVE